MTPERMKEAFDSCYEQVVTTFELNADLKPQELQEDLKLKLHCFVARQDFAQHILFMCERGKEFVDEDRIEKANRWLGFVQGYICSAGLASIDEMKRWNMPKEEENGS